MYFQILLRRAYVDPVFAENERQNGFLMFEQRWEQTALEGVRLSLWHVLQNTRLQNVDAGVDGVAGDLIRPRLFDESLNPAIGAGFDESVSRRIFHWRKNNRCNGVILSMVCHNGGEIDVRQDIAVE